MRQGSKVKVTKVKSKELVLQFFVVFLKCTLEKGLYVCTLPAPAEKIPVSCFSCLCEFTIIRKPVNSQESLIVARMLKFCCHTHWATVLVANCNCLAQSNPQQLCNLHPTEQSQQDQVSAYYKDLLPGVKGHPCQTGWACQHGPIRWLAGAFQCMRSTLPILIHSTKPGHGRVFLMKFTF